VWIEREHSVKVVFFTELAVLWGEAVRLKNFPFSVWLALQPTEFYCCDSRGLGVEFFLPRGLVTLGWLSLSKSQGKYRT
jgi:hypothetical protein